MAQWLRTRLPMQGTQVQALVQEDPTCHGATKPVHHNYRACALSPWATTNKPACHNYWSPCTQSPCSATREATAMRSTRSTTKSSHCSPQLEKARAQQRRPTVAKNKFIKKKKEQYNHVLILKQYNRWNYISVTHRANLFNDGRKLTVTLKHGWHFLS